MARRSVRLVPHERATLAAAVAVLAVVALSVAVPAVVGRAATLRVGRMRLHHCADDSAWWCGVLRRPLDPRRPRGARIPVAFRWRPAPGHAPALVALDGGPGSPSTSSADVYTGVFGPLLRRHGLLLVDDRGTGGSALVDCPALQGFSARTDDPGYVARVTACARRIDARYAGRVSAGTHPANLFATAYAADDIAAVAGALGLGPVDLYGVSYGTYLAQSIMARHPRLLRAVALDSAFPARGLDPWYASSGAAARAALGAVCRRDRGCSAATAALADGPAGRLARLVARLRAGPPLTALVPAGRRTVRRQVDVRTLVDLVQDAGGDVTIDQELDAAVRAALRGDARPLARLAAEGDDRNHGPEPAAEDSNGLYFAVACTDYPQLFPMGAAPAQRRAVLRATIAAAARSRAFAPFTVAEWLSMSAYSETYSACLDWPHSPHVPPPVADRTPPLPPSVPVLVIGGDLDSITPVRDARRLARSLGRASRVVQLRNTVHATTEGDDGLLAGSACGRGIVRRFFADPGALARLDAGCARRVPPVHAAASFPQRLAGAAPAQLVAGRDPGAAVRRSVTVGADALADVATRLIASGLQRGAGLRGGSFRVAGDEVARIALHDVRFVGDAAVSGRATYRVATGEMRGVLVVRRRGAAPVAMSIAWRQSQPRAHATVRGARLALPVP